MKTRSIGRRTVYVLAAALATWMALEIAVRVCVDWPLATDFYGSIPRDVVRARQARFGVQLARGKGWAHLGWIADPDAECYRIERRINGDWHVVGRSEFGSYLVRESGAYRVRAEPRDGGDARELGVVEVTLRSGTPPLFVPHIAGPWRNLFRPRTAGDYINDHTVYQDAAGHWRLIGITGEGDGDYASETRFAVAVSTDFPPASGMAEAAPVADFGELAWAPHVVVEAGTYHLFWSPHRLHRMTSADGVTWTDHRVLMTTPFDKFFRDPMVLKVADRQWLLYSTARGTYFSQVDVYQSFDLDAWQYIGTALRTSWGSERNAPFASTESPFVVPYRERYYLAITYNNDSFFWSALLLLLKVRPDAASYNDTLVFHSDNPYDFGEYDGRGHAPTLVTRLVAHAAEFVYQADSDAWYITTAGWPWAVTLTSGEAAVAPLRWDPAG